MSGLLVIAEAGGAAGTGHLCETLAIGAPLRAQGVQLKPAVTQHAPRALCDRWPESVTRMADLEPSTLAAIAQQAVAEGVCAAILNVQRPRQAQLQALRAEGLRVACINELGPDELTCDLQIRPSPAPCVADATVYAGLDYLPLAAEYAQAHRKRRVIDGPIRSLVVSLGGIDRTDATRHVVRILATWPSQAPRHIVVGSGYTHAEPLQRLIDSLPGRWRLHRDVPCLADLLAHADVGLTAGGNTLAELACVGTPALILFEDPHEAEQGRAFERTGFGRCLGQGAAIESSWLLHALAELEDPGRRRTQCAAGTRLVDGDGAARISRLVIEQLLGHTVAVR